MSIRDPSAGLLAVGRWAMLIVLSVVVTAALNLLHLPATLLLGPLIAAAVMAIGKAPTVLPRPAIDLAQAVIGTMIARTIPASILGEVAQDWPIFLPGIVSVIVIAAFLGWLMARWQVLPGTAAVWGSSPGAATAMIIMAEAYGADSRLVAFMQYLRVLVVALVAAGVARVWVGPSSGVASTGGWFPPLHLYHFGATLLLIVGGAVIGRAVRFPAAAMLVPLLIGAVLQNAGLMTIELPPWLLALAYATAGWQIGARFDRAILWHVARALPRLLLAIVALITLCGGVAAMLVMVAGVDPLTAYLATSPGGMDTVAIIGASTNANMPFVMAMQTARMILVMLTGPWVARVVADAEVRRLKRVAARQKAAEGSPKDV